MPEPAVVPICFWCQKPFHELAFPVSMWEKEYGPSASIPDNVIITYELCPRCGAKRAKDEVFIAEGTLKEPEDHRPPLYENEKFKVWPTGFIATVPKKGLARLMRQKLKRDDIETFKKGDVIVLPEGFFGLAVETLSPANKSYAKDSNR